MEFHTEEKSSVSEIVERSAMIRIRSNIAIRILLVT